MKTQLLGPGDIGRAAEILSGGGLVAVPTETVYGLAGNGLSTEAVEKIYRVKGRPEQKPLSLMVSGKAAASRCWESVPRAARVLAGKYWPGPLTIAAPSLPGVPEIVRAGGETVALRCPEHPLALELLRALDFPLAAPSANPSGAKSPRTAREVMEYFDGKIDAVLDGGECRLGVESSIIDLSQTPYKVLREGAVPTEELEKTLMDGLCLIGITGGSGCGKTTALGILEELGALVIDCDAVYHELTRKDADMRRELCARFGDVYRNGELDRKELGAVVFSDAEALKELSELTSRYINREVDRRLRKWAMSGGAVAAVDAIALLDSGIAPRCRTIVGVIAPTEERIRRLMAREGVSEDYARLRIEAQKSNEYFIENCGHVLDNSGTQEELRRASLELFTKILKEEA